MFVLLLVSLLLIDSSHTLQCVTNCTIGEFNFYQPLQFNDKLCEQRISASRCSVDLDFNYYTHTYSAIFEHNTASRDFIYINSRSYLSYNVRYPCSKDANCALSYAQNRVNEMSDRAYNVTRIYDQLEPLIVNSSKSDSIQCYNIKNAIVQCAPTEVCNLDYDQRANKMRTRGCKYFSLPTVMVYNSETYSSFEIVCNRSLCNDDVTLSKIKTIFADNRLTDANGRLIAAGTKTIASAVLLIFILISKFVFYF
ncbi:unnamed protein product [Adineta steineri]|uniref:Uncharacterized protein n=1 Tax=Adineta steineri TaxID=433720 RepID=A0A819AJL9_9BILA|nr:unnamed protein product [Adineta steineri]